MNLSLINRLTLNEATETFLKCCGSERWAEELASARPYSSSAELLHKADQAFISMDRGDWLAAFAAHPKIGDIDSLKQKYGNTKNWAKNEQSGVEGCSIDTLEQLASGNKAYEERFGYIFIVCATGKSAQEMLSILQGRIDNEAEKEFAIAQEEQKKITRIRLEKL